uniref:Uncharacterized protein n=1 Tax=Caulobacter phage BL57 TaxID=3348355 RepID=A0AB74UMU8_9VIRU
MSRPSIAVVSQSPTWGPKDWEIVDLKVVDDSRVKFAGDNQMYARSADPYSKAPGWISFMIVLGCFDTWEEASRARNEARAIWERHSQGLDNLNSHLAGLERSIAVTKTAIGLKETERRKAAREPFLGTPTDY